MAIVLEFFLYCFLRAALWFRYRVTLKGFDKLNPETLNKPGGILFLPNHPTVFVDPVVVALALWPKYRLRPLVVEYMYNAPIINWVVRLLNALPVPNFSTSSNSLKRKKTEKVLKEVENGLQQGQNFMIFPSGRVKHTAYEAIDAASAVHRLVHDVPTTNVVLVRIIGLWGSSFSRALTGKNPSMFTTIWRGALHVLKNLLFFTPRRQLTLIFEPNPSDMPSQADRLQFNRYLEHWYNRPDGLSVQEGKYPGDSLYLVSYSMWREILPEVWKPEEMNEEAIDLAHIPQKVRDQITNKLAELSSREVSTITPEQNLTTDLGLDSLDIAELVTFLDDQYDVSNLTVENLTTVGKVMGLAAKQVVCETEEEETETDLSRWKQPVAHHKAHLAEGSTMPEVFLNNCARMGNAVACADMRMGVVTYSQMKLRALVLADYIRKQPGEYIGIMLPASVAASICIMACQLAGKVPLMVNWTVGPRHLQAVMEQSKVKVVLSSWAFLEKLQNVELAEMDEIMVFLEDIRREISIIDKLKAFALSKCTPGVILKALNLDKMDPNNKAVLLFTSGTESMPKGVPLSHYNILSNQRAALEGIDIYSDDVVYGILPPFHSFGFTVSSLIGLFTGVRIAYSPDPTNGKQLAKGFERWGVTIMIGAPSFIRNMFKAATPEQLKTMRLCVTGAEKAPPELLQGLTKLAPNSTLVEGYGITECSPILTMNPPGTPHIGVGKSLPGIELCVVNLDTHVPLGLGQQGLILARGPNIFSGYLTAGLSNPFLTVNGKEWYNTGDLGFLDSSGNLTLSGRLKRFIKVGGEMVSLASIEEALTKNALKNGLGAGSEGPILAICAKEIPGDKPKISLFCKFPANIDDVNKSLRDAGFSNLVRITAVTQLAEIPLMGSGKTNYRALESL